jgi:RNA polymerase sigma-70 factor, ECF subfamily
MQLNNNLYSVNSNENELSFEEVIAQNEEKIVNLIYGMTGDYHLAQDLAQDTFMKAFQSLKNFEGKSKVSTWLYRIAVNTTIDHQRKIAVKKESPSEEIETFLGKSSSDDPDSACQKNGIRNILFKTISELPDQQKEVFLLREINGCSTKEVAEILNCSTDLVKWRLHKARSILRKKLQEKQQYKNVGSFTLNASGIE